MRTLILSLSLIVATSQAFAQKAAPDGFGPIKFGMTKEEAWEAIDGQGVWLEGDILTYVLPDVGPLGKPAAVEHQFLNGEAANVVISFGEDRAGDEVCARWGATIVGAISEVYNKYPIIYDFRILSSLEETAHLSIFYFGNGSTIEVNTTTIGDVRPDCIIKISYNMSTDTRVPF